MGQNISKSRRQELYIFQLFMDLLYIIISTLFARNTIY